MPFSRSFSSRLCLDCSYGSGSGLKSFWGISVWIYSILHGSTFPCLRSHLWISPYCPPCSSPAQKQLLFSVTLLFGLCLCPYGESAVLCDLSTSSPQPLVSVFLHRQVFDALHNISHPGVCPTQRFVERFCLVWPLQGCLRMGQRVCTLSAV